MEKDKFQCYTWARDQTGFDPMQIKYVLLTHEHGDHIGGNKGVVKATGAEIVAHKNAGGRIPNMGRGVGAGDVIKVGKTVELECLDTPGHTMSHICLLSHTDQPALFSGEYRVRTEFGRTIFAKNGFIVSRVEYTKQSGGRHIATGHAGGQVATRTVFMPEHWKIRLSGYDASGRLKSGPAVAQDIAGPLCFAGDMAGRAIEMPLLEPGDYVVLHDTGAYYFSNPFYYNALPAPPVYGANMDEDGNVTLRETRDYISIATTRPETMLGDGAVAVHPSDERYAPIVGKLCEIPVGPKEHRRLIPIITDEYPDPDFGSGAVKITGAHDFNDYGVASRNNIPMYRLMDTAGNMRADGLPYGECANRAQEIAAGVTTAEVGARRSACSICSNTGRS